MPSILKVWDKVINYGVDAIMPFSQQRALRVFNSHSLLTAPLPPISSILIAGGRVASIPFTSACLMTITFISVVLLNKIRFHLFAKVLFYLIVTVGIVTHVWYFGSALYIEFTFVALFIGAFAFSYAVSEIVLLSLVSIIGYVGCVLLGYYVPPIEPMGGGVLAHILFNVIVFGISFSALWLIKSQHEIHEAIIEERNSQLVEQKEEIEAQHSEIISTSNELAAKNFAITSSINYAQRIQQAILPSHTEIKRNFPNSFLFYKPRDIVSGDFYWHLHFYSKSYFAIADCTGHGVPGAFMSMLGSSLLNLTVQSTFADSPKQILKYLDLQVTQMLGRGSEESREGMELVLGVYDHANRSLKIGSTNRPFFLFRNGELIEYKGVKSFIGKSLTEKKPFDEQVIQVNDNDVFYFFTDGITDQFDALNKKKYTIKRLREFITDIHKLDMEKQQIWLEREFEVWRGNTPQTDDMLLMGIRF